MIYKYRFTGQAKNDLDEILSYISVELANSIAAVNFMIELEKSIEKICLFPEICPVIKNKFIYGTEIRKAIINNYLMYYTFNNDINTILRIVYQKRDMNEIFENIENEL